MYILRSEGHTSKVLKFGLYLPRVDIYLKLNAEVWKILRLVYFIVQELAKIDSKMFFNSQIQSEEAIHQGPSFRTFTSMIHSKSQEGTY